MKKINSLIKSIFLFMSAFILFGCVHDDVYSAPNLDKYQCADLTATKTIAQVKALYTGTTYVFPDNSTDVLEGYVSSSDETGNIYKQIYIQDKASNPTQGFLISVDAVSTYTNYPQGSKIFIKLAGLAVGTYGGLIQLGVKDTDPTAPATSVARIPENLVMSKVFRSCTVREKIIPKVMTLADLVTANDQYLGCLVQINNAEFSSKILCNTYAVPDTSIDRQLVDATKPTPATTRVARNSGFASFANDLLPSGNGTFIGVLSKFSSTYQFYINRTSDLKMTGTRLDGLVAPCKYDTTQGTALTVKQVEALYTGTLKQITDNVYFKAKIIANDETGNLFKYIYVEDATGGIRINIDMADMYKDPRLMVGRDLLVNLKGLYIGAINGEVQLGEPFSGNVGRILPENIYKYLFNTSSPITNITATERKISELTNDDVGRWIKIKDVQFIDSEIGKTYADAGSTTNRTLEDCSGNKIILRTSDRAAFNPSDSNNLMKSTDVMLDTGKGDVYAVLSVFNGTYQLWITNLRGADLDGNRCDGSVPPLFKNLFYEDFSSGLTKNWTTANITGTQVWSTSNTGTGSNYYAVMNGFSGGSKLNEDWLISNPIKLSDYLTYTLNFDSDVRFNGNVLEVYITENYTGTPSATTWTKLNPTLDTVTGSFGFANSGNIDLNSYANKTIRVAFKYTSTTSASATWELDNVKVTGRK